jgi:DDE superfamily endonuclease
LQEEWLGSLKTKAKANSYGGHGAHSWIVGMQTQGYPISRHESQIDPQRDVRMYKISWISDNKLDPKVIVARAVQLKIILVLLPSNATHILQPLNVAVFNPFKTTLKRHLESFMIENATTTFSKKDMVQVASSAWLQGVMEKEQNIIHGFKTTGRWPLSFPHMQQRLCLFKSGGIAATKHPIESWLQTKQVICSEVLSLPPRIDNTRKRRKTLDVNNWLLSTINFNHLTSNISFLSSL